MNFYDLKTYILAQQGILLLSEFIELTLLVTSNSTTSQEYIVPRRHPQQTQNINQFCWQKGEIERATVTLTQTC